MYGETETVVQVMPADGWYAVFEDDSQVIRVPLVGWGVIEYNPGTGDDESHVRGLVVEYEDKSSTSFLSVVSRELDLFGKFIRYERDDWNPDVRFESVG